MITDNPSSPAPVIWEHNRSIVDQIVQCVVEEEIYCALLGPRFCGKTALLRHVKQSMRDDLPCTYIDLFEIQAPTQGGFFASLAAKITDGISTYTDRPLPITAEELSSAAFRDFLSGCVDHLASNLIVIFDHLEDLPTDLNRALLTSLRAIYMERQDKESRFIVIVSGALSLAGLTVGETSPFHGIARRLIVGDLTESESEALIVAYSTSEGVQVSPTARSLLLEATRGNPHLIKYICKRSLEAAAKNPSRQVSTQAINQVIREFLRKEALNYDPLQEATRLIEDDPDLLQCILRLLKSETVPLRELPLPLLPDLDPLYLTGMVERVGQDSYRIRNKIYRQYLNEYFDAARVGYLLMFSGRWDAAIEHLESSIVSGNEQSRADLLAATINAMYASKTKEQAAYYLIRGLSAAFRVTEIYIWLIARGGKTLEFLDQKGATVQGVLPIDIQKIPIDADRIEARSYRQACILREPQENARTKWVIPFMVPGQSPIGVVTLCDSLEGITRTEQRKREFHLQSYLNQSARALYEVEFRIQQHNQEKQRLKLEETLRDTSLIIGSSLEQKEVLHRILEEMKKVLPFDTASIQLLDEDLHSLKIIANTGFDDPKRVEALAFPLKDNYPNVLVYEKREPLHFEDIQENFPHFSDPYYQAIHVHGWLGAPLIINDRVIGVITLDSKIPGIYTSEHDRMAVLFAGQAGVAIENARLYETEKDTREDLEMAENNLRVILDTVSVMSKVDHSEAGLFALAERIVTAQPVTFCSILLLDETKQKLILKVAFPNPRPQSTGVNWKPATGERISLAQASIMPHLVLLPEPHVFQRGQKIEGMEVIQYLQQYTYLDEEIRSILTVPLKAGNEVIGICILGETRSWNRSPFDEGKLRLISSMVTQGSVFVDRLRAHEATQNKLLMVERLRSIGEDLVAASSGTAKSVLDKVVRAACDVTGANSAIIYPWDNQMRTYDTDKIVHFGLTKQKSFSDKVRDEEGSMTTIVLRKGMVIVDDIQNRLDRSGNTQIWASYDGFLATQGVQAFVGVSLGRGEDALGVLFVNFLEPHYFSDSELEAVNLFANQAAIAIENARLYEDLDRRLGESLTLQKVGISLAETRDLNLVLDRVMQAALELIHADEGSILFYDESKDEFLENALMSLGIGLPLQSYKTDVRQRSGYSYEIIKNVKPIRISDTASDSHISKVSLEKGRRAVLGVPLIGRDNPVGVLWMDWKTPHRISEEDEKLLMALASQAAVSIENVDLFEKLKAENARRNEESRALQEVGISLTESIELKEVLYRVLQAALEVVNAEEDTILFYDESRDEFDAEAWMCTGLNQPLQTYQTKVRQREGLGYQIIRRRRPEFISDTLLDPRISQVAIDKGRRATVGVPLIDHDGPVGVLWVNWKAPRQVSSREASLLTALASQATVAITGARRYEEIKRRSAHLQAVHEAGKVISAASIGLNRQQILDRILEQAIECVTGVSGSKASFGSIQSLVEETNELVVESVFPLHYSQMSIAKFDHISLDAPKTQDGRIGITGRAAVTKLAQLVPDVSKDEDYIAHNDDIKSELAIPILDNDKVIGVMDVESNKLNAFDELDKVSLGSLVDLAVVALRNADQAEQLTRSNVVALMGAWGAEIVHVVNREVGYIRREVFLLRKQPRLSAKIKEKLSVIEKAATHLALPKIPEYLPGIESFTASDFSLLDSAIHEIVKTYQSGHPEISFQFEPGCPDIQVAMHEQFILAIFQNLLRNAIRALSKEEVIEKTVQIRSRVDGHMAIIEVENSGPPLRPEIIPYLFKRLISHDDGRKGRGLLLVGFFVERHGGRIESTQKENGKGVIFRFWLPLFNRLQP